MIAKFPAPMKLNTPFQVSAEEQLSQLIISVSSRGESKGSGRFASDWCPSRATETRVLDEHDRLHE